MLALFGLSLGIGFILASFALVAWPIVAVSAIIIANKKGQNGCGFITLSLCIPFIAIIVALVMPANTSEMERRALQSGQLRQCPSCAELVKRDARVCRYCGSALPELPVETVPEPSPAWEPPVRDGYRPNNVSVPIAVAIGAVLILTVVVGSYLDDMTVRSHVATRTPSVTDPARPLDASGQKVASVAPADTGTDVVTPTASADMKAKLQAYLDAAGQNDLDALRQQYSDPINFYGELQPLNTIMQDKARYIARWPNRTYQLRDPSFTVTCSRPDHCQVSGIIDWTASNPGTGQQSAGVSQVDLTFDYGLITAEGGKVISRQ